MKASTKQLFKKEYRILEIPFYIGGILLLLLQGLSLYNVRFIDPIFGVYLIMPALMLYSLQYEARYIHRWLHSPIAVEKLLWLKVICVYWRSFEVIGLNFLLLWGLEQFGLRMDSKSMLLAVYSLPFLIGSVIGITNVLLPWSLYQWLKRKYKKWNIFLLVLFLGVLYSSFVQGRDILNMQKEVESFIGLDVLTIVLVWIFLVVAYVVYFNISRYVLEKKVE